MDLQQILKLNIPVLSSNTEKEYFEIYYSLDETNQKEKHQKDLMSVEIYDFYKNMFFNELNKTFTNGSGKDSYQDYESNFKIQFFQCIKKFDISKGYRFSTFLFGRIKKAVQKTNAENSEYSVKEYRLNILNIFKSKILQELTKMNNSHENEQSYINYEDIIGNKMINFRKIYEDMYTTMNLPKLKFESLIKDLPLLFKNRVSENEDSFGDFLGFIGNNDNVLTNETVLTNGFDKSNLYLDIYFEITNIYKNSNGNHYEIFKKLILKGFKVECNLQSINDFLYSLKKGGADNILDFIDENLISSTTALNRIEKRLFKKRSQK